MGEGDGDVGEDGGGVGEDHGDDDGRAAEELAGCGKVVTCGVWVVGGSN